MVSFIGWGTITVLSLYLIGKPLVATYVQKSRNASVEAPPEASSLP